MGDPLCAMAFVPYSAGYGYPYGYPGAYGPYGPSLEEVKKIREAEEKAFKDAEAKRLELIEAEKKQYEEYVAAQKKAVEDAVAKEKEFYEKERDLVKKLGIPVRLRRRLRLRIPWLLRRVLRWPPIRRWLLRCPCWLRLPVPLLSGHCDPIKGVKPYQDREKSTHLGEMSNVLINYYVDVLLTKPTEK